MHDSKLEPNYMRLDIFYEFYSLNCCYTTVIHLKTSLYLRLVYYSFAIIYIRNVYYILKVITLVFKLDDYSSVYSQRYPYISPLHFPLLQVTVRFWGCCLPPLFSSKSVLMWWLSYLNLSKNLVSFWMYLFSKPF